MCHINALKSFLQGENWLKAIQQAVMKLNNATFSKSEATYASCPLTWGAGARGSVFFS